MSEVFDRGARTTVIALAVVFLLIHPVGAVPPTVLMFYGGTLKQPVFVAGVDTDPFGDLFRPTSISAKDMGDRPYVSIAMFWGTQSDPAGNGSTLADLKPEMAWQHGRFYPATAGKPAIMLATPLTAGATKRFGPMPIPTDAAAYRLGGPVPPAALAVLERLGVIGRSAR